MGARRAINRIRDHAIHGMKRAFIAADSAMLDPDTQSWHRLLKMHFQGNVFEEIHAICEQVMARWPKSLGHSRAWPLAAS